MSQVELEAGSALHSEDVGRSVEDRSWPDQLQWGWGEMCAHPYPFSDSSQPREVGPQPRACHDSCQLNVNIPCLVSASVSPAGTQQE